MTYHAVRIEFLDSPDTPIYALLERYFIHNPLPGQDRFSECLDLREANSSARWLGSIYGALLRNEIVHRDQSSSRPTNLSLSYERPAEIFPRGVNLSVTQIVEIRRITKLSDTERQDFESGLVAKLTEKT